MRKVLLILAYTLFMVSCSKRVNPAIFSDSQVNSENLNPKITASFFNDISGTMTCEELEYVNFTPVKFPFLPGYCKGIIWIDITYPYTENETMQSLINMSFGNEYFRFAEIFYKDNSGWNFYARTGKGLNLKDISAPDWSMQIIINNRQLVHNDMIHLRVRMFSETAYSINFQFEDSRHSIIKIQIYQFLFSFFIGSGFIMALLYMIIAIYNKDKFYFYFSMVLCFQLLFQLTIKGIGSVYIWNYIAPMNFSYKIEFFFQTIQLLLMILCVHISLREENKTPLLQKKLNACFLMTFLFLFSSLFIDHPIVFNYFFFIFFNICNLFLSFIIICSLKKVSSKLSIIYISWLISIFFNSFQYITFLLRISGIQSMKFFSASEPYSAPIVFYIIAFSSFYLVESRSRSRYRKILKENSIYEQTLSEVSSRNRTMTNSLYGLSDSSRSIFNIASLLQSKIHTKDSEEYFQILKTKSLKLRDHIQGLKVLTKMEPPENKAIRLKTYIQSLIDVFNAIIKQKDLKVLLSCNFDDNCIISTDPVILELILLNLLEYIFTITPVKSKILITASATDDFNLTIGFSDLNYEFNPDEKEMAFISEAVKIYNGEIKVKNTESDFSVMLYLSLAQITPEHNLPLIEKIDIISIPVNEEPVSNILPVKEETEKRNYITEFDLSKRENQITQLILQGKSDKEIASELNISAQTVATHNKNIFKKTDVHSRVELISKLR